MVRGNLGTIFDGLFPGAGARSVETQILLDMLLLDLDRGIDLLALAASPNDADSASSRRAVAYWFIIQVILNLVQDDGLYIAQPQRQNPQALPVIAEQTSFCAIASLNSRKVVATARLRVSCFKPASTKRRSAISTVQ
jgi:hypothetical protein